MSHFFFALNYPINFIAGSSVKNCSALTKNFIPGFLGLSMFFLPIAFIVLVNVFFYVTTAQAIARMTTYGRIHHKMKYK